ncbi:MAG TPA: M1 family metallopeptidase [Bacteroidales bacterium]|nr:M1 family metallopeptidase [Bacteroidales bacterium]
MQKHLNKYVFRHYFLMSLLILWPFLKASSQDYFQQEVNYKIDVTLNDRKHELSGFESVEYINNSPDTLSYLFFHLWPNAYSDNKTGLARQIFSMKGKGKLFNDPELRGFIDSLDFEVDGNHVQWDLLSESHDICKIILNKPLKHGDTICITTAFHVKIPKGVTSRLGHIGESYQITQWYPKPAVYDRSGWHQMPYLDQAEFYSEFGSFDVSITLPANYVVGATGNLQNEEEKKMLDMLSADTSWMNTWVYGGGDFPPSSKQMKTLRYIENNIHDFAWFADKRFHVLKGTVTLPDSKREVTTWVMFTDQEAYLWKSAISYVNDAVWYFSKWIGDYPYNTFTAVQSALNSGAGMEYPGLTVIGLAEDPYQLDQVIAHEICHSWFYSAVGSDERRYPFMDESIACAYESRYLNEKYPGKKLWEVGFRNRKLAKFFHIDEIPVRLIQELEWLVPARRNMEQPVSLAATEYSYGNYGSIIYNKADLGFNYLRAYLGDSLFDSIMHDYYSKWKNKHPMPGDLRAVFESHTTKDLSWFFDDFLGTTRRLDYKIVRFRDRKLLIKNKGELKAPLVLTGITGDSVSSENWEDGFGGKKWINVPWSNNTEIKIDPEHKMPELFRLNNNIRTSGVFRKSDPLQFRFLYTIEDIEKRTLIYVPAFNWNSSDGFMAGMVLNNGALIPKPVEYIIMPFYTFSNQGLTGYGKISFNITPYDNLIRIATFTLEGEQFGAPGNQNYHKAKIGLDIGFRPNDMIDPVNHKLFGYYLAASDLRHIELLMPAKMRSYLQFGYILERPGIINPFKMSVAFESGKSFQKTSMELNYTFSYYGKDRGLDIRFFTGTMLKSGSADPFYMFSAAGRSGREQYLYQGLYPDRFSELSKTFWSRQMSLSEGGLVSPVNDTLGYSRWLFSFSLTSSLPRTVSWIPVKPFINLLLNDRGAETTDKSPLFFEAGLKAGIWNFFEIYVPILVSDNILSITGSFKERIRFVFRLDILNPFRLE